MSQENIETIRRLYEAFNRRDFDSVAQCLHPDCEASPGAVGPDSESGSRPLQGRAEVMQFLEDDQEMWKTETVEIEEMIEGPDGAVIAVELWRMRGRDEIEVDARCTDIYTFQDGLVVRVDGYLKTEEALEAAGLSKQPS